MPDSEFKFLTAFIRWYGFIHHVSKIYRSMANHEKCPRCGHNYFNGGSGLCRWCVDELNEENLEHETHDYNNPNHWHNNCREDIRASISETERKNAANLFGRNWANIISGLGDQ